MNRVLASAVALWATAWLAGNAAAQQDHTPFLVAPAERGVVLRWAWPEGERPLGYHLERREAGGSWTRITGQPVSRIRDRAQARARLGDAFSRYQPLLFPADPMDELRDPASYRSMLLLLADIEPAVAVVLGLRYDDSDARAGASYQYRLIALTRRGETQVAAGGPVVAGAFRGILPPDSARARQQADGIALRWSTAGSFSAYQVFRRRGARGDWQRLSAVPVIVFSDENGAGTEASAQFYRDTTAAVGDTLAYAVAGIDPFGRLSDRSLPAVLVVRDVIPPAPPSQVSARVRGDSIVIAWVTSPDPQTATYQVWRSASRDGAFEPLGPPAPAGLREARDPGRPAGRLWWYYVTARDAAGNESPPSFMAVAEVPDLSPPEVPDSVRGSGRTGRLDLTWARAAAPDLRGYRVYRSLTPDGDFALLNQTPTPAPRFSDSVSVGADHPFYYRVTAVDSAFNESPPSAVLAVRPPDVTPPSAPQVASVAPGEALVVVAWTPNPEPDVAWYRVRYRIRGTGAGSWIERPDSVAAGHARDTIPGLRPGELVEVSLVAIDDAGNRSELARPVVARAFKRQSPKPVEITRARFRGADAVVIEWGSPPAEVARLVVLRRRLPDSTWVEAGASAPVARRFVDVVPAGWTGMLEYRLNALDRFGNAAGSRSRKVERSEGGP